WDQHVHAGQLAQAHARLDTSGAGSVGVLLDLVRAELAARRASAHDPAQALTRVALRLADLAVQPTLPAPDEASGAVAQVLHGADAHHAWLTSAALRALGMPPRDGIVAEEEWFVIAPRLPELPGVAASVATGAAMLQRQALQRGVVGMTDM